VFWYFVLWFWESEIDLNEEGGGPGSVGAKQVTAAVSVKGISIV